MVNYVARINYLFFISCAVGPISVVGSSLTLLTIYRTKQASSATSNTNRSTSLTTYHRLLMGIAAMDIILSLALTLGPLPIPQELGYPGAHGNTATCTFQGFLMQIGSGSFAYSASLMVYYMLVVRFQWKDATITKYAEPVLHAVPILFHGVTGILGFFWEVYNPQGTKSWVGAYPPGCKEEDPKTCERGGEYERVFGIYLTFVPAIVYTGIIVLALLVVALTVWQKHQSMRWYNFEGSSVGLSHQRQMRLVCTQCLLYGFLFLNLMIWSIIASIFYLRGVEYQVIDKHFWMALLAQTLYPL